MQLTDAQLETIRTRPQQTRLYLSVFQPRTVMQCRVNNAAIAKGAMTIAYNTVTLGSYLDVEAGMTLLIGTTLGGREVGRLRIRSASASSFSVSENSNINWQNGLYLTVLRYWEVWPIFPRIIQNPSNIEDVIFYKDYDLAYTNQNSILGTFVNAGPHRAAFLDGGQAQIWYSATGTLNLLGASLSYYWTFEGGTPTGSNLATPGYITYSTPGHYVTRLAISGSNGSSDVTYRYVSIYDRFGNGTSNPIKRWELADINGSRAEAGFSATIQIYDQIQIDDNSVIVIFAEDWYDTTKQSFGGNYPNASGIFFVGYVEKDSIQYDYRHSLIQFNVVSVTGLMKDSMGFSVSTQSDKAPDTWYKILDLDVRRSIYHYLKWHTTVPMVADIQFVGQDQKIQYFDADRSSMFDAIDNLMKGTLIGAVVSDRQGKIWAEVDAQAYTNPTGSFPPVMDISKRDWRGEPTIDERIQEDASYLEYGGIAYSGINTGTFQALLACAPGNAPSFRGTTTNQEGLALSSQAHLNQLVGNLFANKASKYPSVRMDITENLRNLDIAPQETVGVHIDAQDTNKNVPLNILGIPSSFTWTYDHKNGVLVPTITFSNLVSGNPGDTISIPPPSDEGNNFKQPPIVIPNIPPFQFPFASGTTSLNAIPSAKWQGASSQIISDGTPVTITIGSNIHNTSMASLFFSLGGSLFTFIRRGIYRITANFEVVLDIDYRLGMGEVNNGYYYVGCNFAGSLVGRGYYRDQYQPTMFDKLSMSVEKKFEAGGTFSLVGALSALSTNDTITVSLLGVSITLVTDTVI